MFYRRALFQWNQFENGIDFIAWVFSSMMTKSPVRSTPQPSTSHPFFIVVGPFMDPGGQRLDPFRLCRGEPSRGRPQRGGPHWGPRAPVSPTTPEACCLSIAASLCPTRAQSPPLEIHIMTGYAFYIFFSHQ